MNWEFFTEHWSGALEVLPGYFPDARALHCPSSDAEMAAFIAHLARSHDLTLAETTETLGDLALGILARHRQVSEVTHKMVASS